MLADKRKAGLLKPKCTWSERDDRRQWSVLQRIIHVHGRNLVVAVMFGAVHRAEGIGYRPPCGEYEVFLKRTISLPPVYTVDNYLQISNCKVQASMFQHATRGRGRLRRSGSRPNTGGRLLERRESLKRDGALGGH
jgi:hypothetical protein